MLPGFGNIPGFGPPPPSNAPPPKPAGPPPGFGFDLPGFGPVAGAAPPQQQQPPPPPPQQQQQQQQQQQPSGAGGYGRGMYAPPGGAPPPPQPSSGGYNAPSGYNNNDHAHGPPGWQQAGPPPPAARPPTNAGGGGYNAGPHGGYNAPSGGYNNNNSSHSGGPHGQPGWQQPPPSGHNFGPPPAHQGYGGGGGARYERNGPPTGAGAPPPPREREEAPYAPRPYSAYGGGPPSHPQQRDDGYSRGAPPPRDDGYGRGPPQHGGRDDGYGRGHAQPPPPPHQGGRDDGYSRGHAPQPQGRDDGGYGRPPHGHSAPPPHGGYPNAPPRPPGAGPPGRAPGRSCASTTPLRDATNTFFAGGVDQSVVPDERVYEIFSKYGKILRVGRMAEKGVLFVHYGTVEEATAAVTEQAFYSELPAQCKVNYGKGFNYSPEELAAPEWKPRGFGGGGFDHGGGGGGGGDRKRARSPGGDRDAHGGGDGPGGPPGMRDPEPSNIVWVGDLPSAVSTDDLRRNFEGFGTIVTLNRPMGKNLAFIHFSSIAEARHAIDVMRGVPISGFPLKLNFGKQAPGSTGVAGQAGPRDDEVVTNVVWFGGLPDGTTIDELNAVFDSFEGYIDCRLLQDHHIAFGHFETVEQAKQARRELHGFELRGAILRVCFGKAMHTRTLDDRFDRQRDLDAHTGALALAAGGAENGDLILPEEANAASAQLQAALLSAQPKYLRTARPAPPQTLSSRLAALKAGSYTICGEDLRFLGTERIVETMDRVDLLADEAGANELKEFACTLGMNMVHLFNIVAKRLAEKHAKDVHKKLHCLYAVAAAFFLHASALASGPDPTYTTIRPLVEAFANVLAVSAEQQTDEGLALIRRVTDALSDRVLKAMVANRYGEELREQVETIFERKKASADFSMLLAAMKGGASTA